jgi:hypothetical protein
MEVKRLVYSMALWNIVRTFGIFYGHFGNLVAILYIFPHFGILCQEKSGNPAGELTSSCQAVISLSSCKQGDQIGRIFAHLGECLLWALF